MKIKAGMQIRIIANISKNVAILQILLHANSTD
jgi:hypothetical protein